MRLDVFTSSILFLVLVAVDATTRLQLERQPSLFERLLQVGDRQGLRRYATSRRDAANDSQSPLTHYGPDGTYRFPLSVGTPATQRFSVALDTATALFWVPDVTCIEYEATTTPATGTCVNCPGGFACYEVCDPHCCPGPQAQHLEEQDQQAVTLSKLSTPSCPPPEQCGTGWACLGLCPVECCRRFDLLPKNREATRPPTPTPGPLQTVVHQLPTLSCPTNCGFGWECIANCPPVCCRGLDLSPENREATRPPTPTPGPLQTVVHQLPTLSCPTDCGPGWECIANCPAVCCRGLDLSPENREVTAPPTPTPDPSQTVVHQLSTVSCPPREQCGTGWACLGLCSVACCRLYEDEPKSRDIVFNPVCGSPSKFDSKRSSSYRKTSYSFYNVDTLDFGQARGIIGQDTVQIGNLTITGVGFGQVNDFAMDDYPLVGWENYTIQGVLGIGFSPTALPHTTPALLTAFNEDKLDNPIVSLYMTSTGGAVTFGDLDSQNCDTTNINWIPVTKATGYNIAVDKLAHGDLGVSNKYSGLSASTGIHLGIPAVIASDLAKDVNANFDPDLDFYSFKCGNEAKIRNVTITLGGKDYVVPGSALAGKIETDMGAKECYLKIWNTNDEFEYTNVILGEPFLQAYCTFYNFGTQHFGVSNHLN